MGQAKSRGADGEQEKKDELQQLLVRPANKQLGLHNLKLEEVPPEIFRWTDLETLRLDVNLIRTVPSSLASLARLTELSLSGNLISSLLPQDDEDEDDEDDEDVDGKEGTGEKDGNKASRRKSGEGQEEEDKEREKERKRNDQRKRKRKGRGREGGDEGTAGEGGKEQEGGADEPRKGRRKGKSRGEGGRRSGGADGEIGGLFALVQLRKLNLSSNLLETVPAELTRLTSLTYIDLSNNRLKSLPSLRELTQLTHLVLNVNSIERLPPLPPSLVLLHASRNNLGRFGLPLDDRVMNDVDGENVEKRGKKEEDRAEDQPHENGVHEVNKEKKEKGKEKKKKKESQENGSAAKASDHSGEAGILDQEDKASDAPSAAQQNGVSETTKGKTRSKSCDETAERGPVGKLKGATSRRLSLFSRSDSKAEELRSSGVEEPWYGRLQELDLSENKLSEVPPIVLLMTNLGTLQLSCNNISSLPDGFAQAWPRLAHLRLAFNDLHDLPSEIMQLQNLKRIDFRGNPFQLTHQLEALTLKCQEREEQRKRYEEERKRLFGDAEMAKTKKKGKKKKGKKGKKEKKEKKGKKGKKGKKEKKESRDGDVEEHHQDEEDEKTEAEDQTIKPEDLKLPMVPRRESEEDDAKAKESHEDADEQPKPNWVMISEEFTKKCDWDYNAVDDIMLPDEILPGLYLGSLLGALNKHLLHHLGITHILTVANQLTPAFPERFTYKQVLIDDHESEDIMQHFESCLQFIEAAMESRTKILVHCRAGVSRSASVVIAYVMMKKKMNVDDARTFVRERRPIVCPNMGFHEQLQMWEAQLRERAALATIPAPARSQDLA